MADDYQTHIPPSGPLDADMVFIGMAPARDEVKHGEVFVGPSGRELSLMCNESGISRPKVHIRNIVSHRVPSDDLPLWARKNPELYAEHSLDCLHAIERINPKVIVPLGLPALKLFTQQGKIGNWRGSPLRINSGHPDVDSALRHAWVIPTYHPAAFFSYPGKKGGNYKWRSHAVLDFRRAKYILDNFDTFKLPQYEMLTDLSFEETIEELRRLRQTAGWIACDIETRADYIVCIGFASIASRGLCVPFTRGLESYWTEEEELAIWEEVRLILEGSIPKIFQNALFDVLHLRKMGVNPRNLFMDTMTAHHTVWAELPHGLDFLVSQYCWVPYYKDERKAGGEDLRVPDQQLWEYNIKDVVLPIEIASKLCDKLVEMRVEKFYHNHVQGLFAPLLYMSERGIKVDLNVHRELQDEASEQVKKLKADLNEQIGRELNMNSPKQVAAFLYDEVGLPEQYDRKTGKRTTDKEALSRLERNYKHPWLKTMLNLRKMSKRGEYFQAGVDDDGRMRCSWNPTGAETGRLSSSKSLSGSGRNLQNVTQAVRRMFIADQGHVLIAVDGSMAEARVVAEVSGDKMMKAIFDEGRSIHKVNAGFAFDMRESMIEKGTEEYDTGKTLSHSFNYKTGYITFANKFNTDFPHLHMSHARAKGLLAMMRGKYRDVPAWWATVERELRQSRTRYNPLGRVRTFLNRWGDSLFREAIADLPQGTIADVFHIILQRAFKRLVVEPMLEGRAPLAENLLQVHDELVFQCKKGDVDEVRAIMEELSKVEISFKTGRTLVIPMEISVGENWGEL